MENKQSLSTTNSRVNPEPGNNNQNIASAKGEGMENMGFSAIAENELLKNSQDSVALARSQAVLNSTTDFVWCFDENLNITLSNDAFALLALKPDKAREVGFPIAEMLPPGTEPFWAELFNACLNGQRRHTEVSRRDKNGNLVWWEINLYPVQHTEGNIKVKEVAGSARNITLRKEADMALLRSETKFRQIFNALPDIYFQTNPDGVITLVSPSVSDVFGYRPDEITGTNICDYTENFRNAPGNMMELLEQGHLKNLHADAKSRSGIVLHFICNITVQRDESGLLTGFEGLARNISELRLAGQQIVQERRSVEHHLRIKEQFLANMSHEIRTPVNGIMGALELLAGGGPDVNKSKYLSAARQSAGVLTEILNDILDVSRMEGGSNELHYGTFRTSELADSMMALFELQARAKGLNYSQYFHPNLPAALSGDKSRILQVLTQLCGNAIKFTDSGSISLTLYKVSEHNRKIRLAAEISDTGQGIDEKAMSGLFMAFNPGDNSTTKKHSGLGLGLALAKQRAMLLNGDIAAESLPGRGSIFTFTFDCITAKEELLPETKLYTSPPEIVSPVTGFSKVNVKAKVLVVEDNPINLLITGEILRNAGCKVTEAHSGADALACVETEDFDVVLMDVQMPVMDGLTTAVKIKALPLAKQPVIIALTAYAMPGDKERFLAAGMDDYLSKPIEGHTLLETVYLHSKGTTENNSFEPGELPYIEEAGKVFEQQVYPVLNKATLDSLKQYISFETIAGSMREFEDEAAELLVDAWKAVSNNDSKSLCTAIHTLKGTSLTIGAEALGMQAGITEKKLRENPETDISSDLNTLQLHFREFCHVSADYLRSNQAV
ncbi:MAG: response regulator [Bacteroidota bacterium]